MHVSSLGAAWLARTIPTLCAAVELWLTNTFRLASGLISKGLYHALINLIEGGITAIVIALIATSRPDILGKPVGAPPAGVTARKGNGRTPSPGMIPHS